MSNREKEIKGLEFIESYIKTGLGDYKWNGNHGELIRCRDCKWHTMLGEMLVCTTQNISHPYDWYCAGGKRNEEEVEGE